MDHNEYDDDELQEFLKEQLDNWDSDEREVEYEELIVTGRELTLKLPDSSSEAAEIAGVLSKLTNPERIQRIKVMDANGQIIEQGENWR